MVLYIPYMSFIYGGEMQYVIQDEQHVGMRIDKFLDLFDENMSRSLVQKMIENETILVNYKPTKASYKLKLNDCIDIEEMEEAELEVIPEDIPLDIVFEDEDIIIINKSRGMVVHPGNGNYTGTLVNALLFSHKDRLSAINGVIRPGIVHRIDKDTSGIIVVAKNDKAHKTLSSAFKVHDITRKYIAIVKGIINKDNIKIDLPIGRSTNDRIKMAVTEKNSRDAVTYIKVLERFYNSNYTLVEATLETGRTHQIRVHMSYIGHPLLGDDTYSNGKNEFGIVGQLLHAKVLGFNHPTTGEYIEFEKEEPQVFKGVLNKLREKENK